METDRAQSWFLNSKILFQFRNRSEQRDPKTFNFFQIELWGYLFVFRSSSELVSKFKNSSSEIDQERDPKTFNFFQIELRNRAQS